jgi:predicted amidohydrolase
MAPNSSQTSAYQALAWQFRTEAVNQLPSREDARTLMMSSIERVKQGLLAAKGWIGQDLKLVVMPEYFLTGFPMGDSIEGWADKAAIEINGPEYEALGKIAQEASVFLSGNAYEQDPNFPGIYFQTSFIIDPSGEVILRYRRLISMYAPSPYDYLDRYLDVYGEAALFPVADTEIGRLACIASEEILYPEIARCLAMNGAEVFLHSSSEIGGKHLTPKNIAKQARALENLTYLVSANSGGLYGCAMSPDSTDGGSKVVNYYGQILSEALPGESIVGYGELDLNALRRFRAREGMPNLLSRQPMALYAKEYAKADIAPANFLMDEQGEPRKAERSYFAERQRNVLANMKDKGIIQD